MFAYTALGYVVEMATHVWNDTDMADKALQLANDIQRGIQDHAIVEHPLFGRIYAYEVDGLGNYLLMDDANLPSFVEPSVFGISVRSRNVCSNSESLCGRPPIQRFIKDQIP